MGTSEASKDFETMRCLSKDFINNSISKLSEVLIWDFTGAQTLPMFTTELLALLRSSLSNTQPRQTLCCVPFYSPTKGSEAPCRNLRRHTQNTLDLQIKELRQLEASQKSSQDPLGAAHGNSTWRTSWSPAMAFSTTRPPWSPAGS